MTRNCIDGRDTCSDESGVSGATGELLDEVERFMLDVANSPDNKSALQLAQWRQRINQASLLFKVRILQSNLRQKEDKI